MTSSAAMPKGLDLAPGERVVLHIEQDRLPYWAALALLGAGFIVYGMSDPIYGWSTFFLGMVFLAFLGGAVSSTRYHVTDRRLVRTGYMGARAVPLAGAKVTRARGAFGDVVTVENDGARLRMRTVRDGPAVERVLRRERA